ncbi:FG-GAP-like repeat-containing protein [Methylobacterium tarhaniae]|uniref:FG-GAP-like repeat-containing protein n=1 Tax=Methylobacterium tarhaniae TaxID=1187852 RepID=UPI003CFD77EB
MSDASRNPRLVVEGDSLSASGIWIPYALQAASASNRFALPSGYNQAVGGETALQMMSQVGAVNAIKPDVVVLLAGTNDLGLGATASTVYNRLKTMWKSYLDAGADYVVAVDIPPRNDPGWMKNYFTLEARRIQLNNLINHLANDADLANYKNRIKIAKDFSLNPSADTIDGIHENAAGAKKIGDAIGAALSQMNFSLPADHDDFSGDGRGDMLWRNTAGSVTAWITGGSGQVVSTPIIGSIGPEWIDQGTGDLNGDGVSDILWRDSAGHINAWLMGNGSRIASAPNVGTVGPDWTIQGIGDLNGDGRSDILWRDNAGHINAWLLDGKSQVSSAPNIGTVGSEWMIKGVADLNGDGVDDILWQDNAGHINEWILGTNGQVSAAPNIGTVTSDSALIATGDFDGDGTDDLLWRDARGQVSEWLMHRNGQVSSTPAVGIIGLEARLLGTGDYNGDGRTDLMWRDTSGSVNEWLLGSNGQVASVLSIGTIGSEWSDLG